MKNIVVTGSIAYDYIFDFANYFSNYFLADKVHNINISLLTENYKKSFGGTAGNQGFYLNKLGIPALIFTYAGSDFEEYTHFLKKNKIESKFIKIDNKIHTAAGFAITDKKDNQIWMYSKGAMKLVKKLRLKTLMDSIGELFVLITPNEPKAVENFIDECVKYKIEFILDLGFNIPITSKKILVKGIKNALIIFGNDYEISLMEKIAGFALKKKLTDHQILITTFADEGSEIYSQGKKYPVDIFKTKTVDPTGAGDAYRAGFVYGYLNNYPIETCGWMGAVAASFAVETKGTMNLKFSKKEFKKRVQSKFV